MSSIETSTETVVTKSPYDKKEYRFKVLNNGLKVLLITKEKLIDHSEDSDESMSDDDSEGEEELQTHSHTTSTRNRSVSDDDSDDSSSSSRKKKQDKLLSCSSCALSVRVGSFHDPPQLPGLAHLLEHMLFMGSDKYPGENEFDSFVSTHGGTNNANTDYETTCYYFEINKKFFKQALNMFSHLFVSPLLLQSSLDREIEAVDSEFHDSYRSDSDRLQQLLCSLADKNHPLQNFPCGNRDTLKVNPQSVGVDVLKYLREFYLNYYSASYMTLAVVSEDSLDTLDDWVQSSFASIPSNDKTFPSISHCQPVFNEDKFHRLYKIVPIKDINKLQLTWHLPSILEHYKEKPLDYIASLVGHEGSGSILSLLKKRNLATGLVAGCGSEEHESNSCFSLFTISIKLTENGLNNVQEVLCIVFQYLEMLAQTGPQEHIYKELQAIESIEFTFSEEEECSDLVERLCMAMQFYLPEDILTGDTLYFEYNPDIISSMQQLLTFNRCNIFLISQSFTDQCHKRAKWYDTLYTDEDIDPQIITYLTTSDFTLVQADVPQTKYPVVIDETSHYKLWYKKDNKFDLPRASINILFLISKEHFVNIKNFVSLELFVNLFGLSVTEIVYDATTAQLDYSLLIANCGLCLQMYGLSHKLPDLFEMLVKYLSTFEVTDSEFKMAKEQLKKFYFNLRFKNSKFCRHLRLSLFISKEYFLISQRLSCLENLTLEDCKAFVEQLRSCMFVEALVQGNITANDSKKLMEFLVDHWKFTPLNSELIFQPECLQLPPNTQVHLTVPNNDSNSHSTTLTNYYQCTPADLHEQVMSELLTEIMYEPCFDTLRTKKQLGYTVYVDHHNTYTVSGFSINVNTQQHKFSVSYVTQCMDQFIEQFTVQLESYTPEEFNYHVESLIDNKEDDDISLEEEVERNWSEICNRTYVFDRLEKHVKVLERVSKNKLCRWFAKYTQPGKEQYRKLCIKIVSQQTLDNATVDTVPSNGSPLLQSELNERDTEYCEVIVLSESDIGSFKQKLRIVPH